MFQDMVKNEGLTKKILLFSGTFLFFRRLKPGVPVEGTGKHQKKENDYMNFKRISAGALALTMTAALGANALAAD